MPKRLRSNQGEKNCQGFFRVSKKQVLLISEIALRNEVILSPQRAKSLSEFYALLKSIWENGSEPFELKGKNGFWKKITHEWLGSQSSCSIKTIERRLAELKDLGLIKYERQGYIPHKYMQLVPIEEAKGHALTDKTLSVTQQSKCPLPKGQNVFYASDNMTVANTRREQKDLKEVSIPKTRTIPHQLKKHTSLINSFWKLRKGKDSEESWEWQINELMKIEQKYGEDVLTDQLEQARGKGWNSIDCFKYEQFNKVEVIEENSEVTDFRRIENMKINAKAFGERSSWMTDPKYKNQYQEILKELLDVEKI